MDSNSTPIINLLCRCNSQYWLCHQSFFSANTKTNGKKWCGNTRLINNRFLLIIVMSIISWFVKKFIWFTYKENSSEIKLCNSVWCQMQYLTCNKLRYRCIQYIKGWMKSIPYSGIVWRGESLANWLVLSIWQKKVWQINRSANRLLIVSTNLVWRITDNSPYSPNFPAVKLSCYTVNCLQFVSFTDHNNRSTA